METEKSNEELLDDVLSIAKAVEALRAENKKLSERCEELEAVVDEKNNLLSAKTYVMDKRMAKIADIERSMRMMPLPNADTGAGVEWSAIIKALQEVQGLEPVLPQVPKEVMAARTEGERAVCCPVCFHVYGAVGISTICPNCAHQSSDAARQDAASLAVIKDIEAFADYLPQDYYRGHDPKSRIAYAIGDWKRQKEVMKKYQSDIDGLHAECHKLSVARMEVEQTHFRLLDDIKSKRDRLDSARLHVTEALKVL